MVEFEWDEANLAHIGLHDVTQQEAEQVAMNDPMDVSYQIIDGEERFGQMGETNAGRVLFVITTPSGGKLRVVTCFRPSKDRVEKYLQRRKAYYE